MGLPDPIGLQSDVLYLNEKGHYVVLGTAGSGKTTLAILRAAYLAKTHCENGERVMLVTFNKALVTYLKSISDDRLENVDVINYHKFAIKYLSRRGLLGNNEIVPAYSRWAWTKTEIIQKAYDIIKQEENSPIFKRTVEVFIEEINWIQKMGITELDEYIEVERIGRGTTRIQRNTRKYFFKVYQKYLELRQEYNQKYDFEDLAYFVGEELERDESDREYKHIIIDEGQDFSPTMLQSLAKAIPPDGSLTYFGDVAQQIYGGRLSWRAAGFKNPKIWRFEQNYRNTKEIAQLGLSISKMKYFKDDVDLIAPQFPRASGALPGLMNFKNEEDEINYIINLVSDIHESETIAILVRDRKTVSYIGEKLKDAGIRPQELKGNMVSWNDNPGVSLGTYHSAKGLEFHTVILPFCSENRLPDQDRIIALEGREEALANDIKLLYVGVTRARRELFISYSEKLTEMLPSNNKGLYQEFNL